MQAPCRQVEPSLSCLYEGSTSERDLVVASGILDKMDRGDSVMADKGSDIEDLLLPIGARLNIPLFSVKKAQANDTKRCLINKGNSSSSHSCRACDWKTEAVLTA